MKKCNQCGILLDDRNTGFIHHGHRFCSHKCTRDWDGTIAGQIKVGEVTVLDGLLTGIDRKLDAVQGDAVEAIFRWGHVLIEAKNTLPHGCFEAYIEARSRLSLRSAQRLMKISASRNFNNLTAKATHGSLLPASWRTLYDLAVLPKETFEGLIDADSISPDMQRGDVKTAVAALTRPDTTATLAAQATQLSGAENGYRAILADPPWRFETRGRGGDRMADHHYPTMSFEDICALPVAELAADDCALFLWITTENLMRGQEVMSSWGFDYKTVAFVWRKTSGPMGLGYWTRKQTELCLMGARGRPTRQARDVEDIIEAPRGRHSKKPDEQYSRIERLVGGPCIELFARTPRAGWDSWGNEVANARDGGDE